MLCSVRVSRATSRIWRDTELQGAFSAAEACVRLASSLPRNWTQHSRFVGETVCRLPAGTTSLLTKLNRDAIDTTQVYNRSINFRCAAGYYDASNASEVACHDFSNVMSLRMKRLSSCGTLTWEFWLPFGLAQPSQIPPKSICIWLLQNRMYMSSVRVESIGIFCDMW